MSKVIAPHRPLSVLVVGDSCDDVYVRGTCSRLSPEAPIPVLDHVSSETVPGMAGNVVVNLKALGCDPELISNLGGLRKTRFVEKRSGQHLLRYDEGADVDSIDDFDEKMALEILERVDAVVVVDYCKGFLTDLTIERLCYKATKLGRPQVYVDSKRADLSAFQSCHVKLNEHEFDAVTSMPQPPYELIVTRGSRGAEHRDRVYPSKEALSICDVVGAGDTFLAAYVYAHLKTGDIPTAIRFANDCALSVVKQFGTSVPTAEDLKRAVEEHLGG